jgi:predicted lactoylglutathione lyase
MSSIDSIILEVPDQERAEAFYATVFGRDAPVQLRPSQQPTSGFRGFALSPVVPRPADVDRLVEAALAAGATTLKAATRSLWGYGGVFRAPDGAIWKVATPAKKDPGPATGRIDTLVLLLGVRDVLASKGFYLEQGFTVARSFGRRYVEFDSPSSTTKLALYGHRALAKDVGVPEEGTGSHRLAITGGGPFTDPDGFSWEPSVTANAAGNADLA